MYSSYPMLCERRDFCLPQQHANVCAINGERRYKLISLMTVSFCWASKLTWRLNLYLSSAKDTRHQWRKKKDNRIVSAGLRCPNAVRLSKTLALNSKISNLLENEFQNRSADDEQDAVKKVRSTIGLIKLVSICH